MKNNLSEIKSNLNLIMKIFFMRQIEIYLFAKLIEINLFVRSEFKFIHFSDA